MQEDNYEILPSTNEQNGLLAINIFAKAKASDST